MIKVAFWYDRPAEYSGGLNYLRNLLFSLSSLEDSRIRPYIFFGNSVDSSLTRPFEALATVVRTSVLDRKSPAWFLHQILYRIFGSLLMVDRAIRPHGVSVVSHAANISGRRRRFRIIGWIPDFQYLHLPEFFPHDTQEGTRRLLKIIRGSDALVLSSFAALADYEKICPEPNMTSVFVLPFVSQPSLSGAAFSESIGEATLKRHQIRDKYFFLPNQFWKHKNHEVVFAAVAELKASGLDVQVVCSGNLRDYRVRDSTYVDGLLQFIDEHDIGNNIKILGHIDYADVLYLMRGAVAVINPSRFEGWSSTVEESRSMGQRIILSDIPVHREQSPESAQFFTPGNHRELAAIMSAYWNSGKSGVSPEQTESAVSDLRDRTHAYGMAYHFFVLALAANQLEPRIYRSMAELPVPAREPAR